MSTKLFIEGLKTARRLMDLSDGVACLDALIAEYEADVIETTAVQPIAETR
jgi:hypothetical protein